MYGIVIAVNEIYCVCLCASDFDIEKCFLRDDVQQILKRITGFNLDKIFRERKMDELTPPEYKLLTTKQLEEVFIYNYNISNNYANKICIASMHHVIMTWNCNYWTEGL